MGRLLLPLNFCDMKIIIKSNQEKKEYESDIPVLLSDAIQAVGVDFPLPCGGKGKCGKCLVEATGELSEPTQSEKEKLGESLHAGFRLACLTKATGDCEVRVPQADAIVGLADFAGTACVDPMTGDKNCLAGVVDIGTTTVAVYLYRMPEGKLLRSCVSRNLQTAVGADVMSRLSYAVQNGTQVLSDLIHRQMDKAFASLGGQPDFTVITGNTAMLHFYENLDCASLAVSPFTPSSRFGTKTETTLLPRCISAFVGADITCGILASGLLGHEKAMLIDVGTNGEIVYKNGDEFVCCSAAAGPAFEGAGIQNGSPAVAGAINKVYALGSRFEYTTVGREKAKSICGSGLIDAIASMLRCDILDETGYLASDFVIGDSGVTITPQDIRQVQNAKAAIRAAIETVCGDLPDVEAFYLAGGFGNYLNLDNAVAIGLLPEEMKKKTVLCGNTAAAGAAMMLFDREAFRKGNEIADKAKTIQLASNDEFYRKYISYMYF